MKKQLDQSMDAFVVRHLSQLKILVRLIEHEMVSAKGQSLNLDRELAENLLDLLEIFIDDMDVRTEGKVERDGKNAAEPKATVTRLN